MVLGHPQDDNFERIFVVTFSIFVHAKCVSDTKKLAIAYSFTFLGDVFRTFLGRFSMASAVFLGRP